MIILGLDWLRIKSEPVFLKRFFNVFSKSNHTVYSLLYHIFSNYSGVVMKVKYTTNSVIAVLAILVSVGGAMYFFACQHSPSVSCSLVPHIVYHGTPHRGLIDIKPVRRTYRDESEGAVIFASPHLDVASMFIKGLDDTWVKKWKFQENGPMFFICRVGERFKKDDSGGAIYLLPATSFECDTHKGMGVDEWVSRKTITPLTSFEYDSALDAMLRLGVQVYFVDDETFVQIERAEDKGRSIVRLLESENQKQDINVREV